jgi:serine/threonine protein kinase
MMTNLHNYSAHGSLYDVLASGSFDFARSSPLRIAREIAGGMAYLHTRATAVLHRDLKSMNVLIDE